MIQNIKINLQLTQYRKIKFNENPTLKVGNWKKKNKKKRNKEKENTGKKITGLTKKKLNMQA